MLQTTRSEEERVSRNAMYQFSRAIYRELAPRIVAPPPARLPQAATTNAVLRACEAVVTRTGHRPPLLRASRTHAVLRHPQLLPDVRQQHVHQVVCRYVGYAQEFLGEHPHEGYAAVSGAAAAVPRDDPQGHRLPARAPAPQRLLPVPPAPRRHRGSGARGSLRVLVGAHPRSADALPRQLPRDLPSRVSARRSALA